MIVYIAKVQPFNTRLLNAVELINEITLYASSLIVVGMSEAYSETQGEGWAIIACATITIAVCFGVMVFNIGKVLVQKVKLLASRIVSYVKARKAPVVQKPIQPV